MDLDDLKMDAEISHGILTRDTAQNITIPRPERQEIISKIDEDTNNVRDIYNEILDEQPEPMVKLSQEEVQNIISQSDTELPDKILSPDEQRKQEWEFCKKEAEKERKHNSLDID